MDCKIEDGVSGFFLDCTYNTFDAHARQRRMSHRKANRKRLDLHKLYNLFRLTKSHDFKRQVAIFFLECRITIKTAA